MTSTHDDTDPRLDDNSPERKNEHADAPQYVSLVLEGGDVVIYDPDNHRAWIQSDFAVEVTPTL